MPTEFCVTCLTPQILDSIRAIVQSIAHQRVNLRIADLEIETVRVRTPIPIGIDDFRSSSPAFPLGPWLNHMRLVRFTHPMRSPTHRTIARTLRMALTLVSLLVRLGKQLLMTVPACPSSPQQPDL